MMIKQQRKKQQIDNKISTSELHEEINRLTTTENEHNMKNSAIHISENHTYLNAFSTSVVC